MAIEDTTKGEMNNALVNLIHNMAAKTVHLNLKRFELSDHHAKVERDIRAHADNYRSPQGGQLDPASYIDYYYQTIEEMQGGGYQPDDAA